MPSQRVAKVFTRIQVHHRNLLNIFTMLTMNTGSARFKRFRQINVTLRGAIAVALGVLAVHVAVLLFIPAAQEKLAKALCNGLSVVESGMAGVAAVYATQKLLSNKARQIAEAWRFFGAAILVYAVGDLIFFMLRTVWHLDPYPSIADAFYLSFYILFLIGLFKLPQNPFQRSEWQKLILDLGMVIGGSAMVFWVLIFTPGLTTLVRNIQPSVIFISFLYPALDLMLLWATMILLIRQRYEASRTPLLFIALGVLVMSMADAIFSYQALSGMNLGGSWPEVVSGLSWLAMIGAAMWQAREAPRLAPDNEASNKAQVDSMFTRLSEHPIYGYLPYLWAWLAYTMLLVLHASTHPDASRATPFNVVIIGVGVMILLVTSRQVITTRENERLSSSLTRLLEASRILSSPLELRPILNLILTELKHIVEFDNAAVLLLQNRDSALALRYDAVSTSSDTASTLPLAPEHRAVIRSGKTMIKNGKGVDETSWLGVPLVVQDKAIGLLSIQCYRASFYTRWHSAVALAFANQAAAAIENARLRTREADAATTAERRRLARELHDSVSQALFGIALGARTAQELLTRDPKRAGDTIDYMLKLTDGALAEMRALIFELRPESLATEGLLVALQKQTKALCTRHSIDAQFLFECEEPAVPVETKEAIYRVALEATQNTIKHAHASHVEIRLSVRNRNLTLDVKDDGQGFDTNGTFPNHFGLVSMRERASNLGGTVEVHSGPGAGTVVQMRVPLPRTPQQVSYDGGTNGARPTPAYGMPKTQPSPAAPRTNSTSSLTP